MSSLVSTIHIALSRWEVEQMKTFSVIISTNCQASLPFPTTKILIFHTLLALQINKQLNIILILEIYKMKRIDTGETDGLTFKIKFAMTSLIALKLLFVFSFIWRLLVIGIFWKNNFVVSGTRCDTCDSDSNKTSKTTTWCPATGPLHCTGSVHAEYINIRNF